MLPLSPPQLPVGLRPLVVGPGKLEAACASYERSGSVMLAEDPMSSCMAITTVSPV